MRTSESAHPKKSWAVAEADAGLDDDEEPELAGDSNFDDFEANDVEVE